MGRRLGLSDDDISKLAVLSKADFEYREWVALKFVRDFAARGGQKPAGKDQAAYENLYSQEEQKYILKTARQMDFFNRLISTITRKDPAETCGLDLKNE